VEERSIVERSNHIGTLTRPRWVRESRQDPLMPDRPSVTVQVVALSNKPQSLTRPISTDLPALWRPSSTNGSTVGDSCPVWPAAPDRQHHHRA
jgi:hypothetical protein